MKLKQIVYVFLIALVFFGCKDKTPTYYVDKEMLRYCWFPEGSYWIYEEANTPGWIDSVYLSDTLHRISAIEGENHNSEGYSYDLMFKGRKIRQGIEAEPSGLDNVVSYISEYYSDSSSYTQDFLLFQYSDGKSEFSRNLLTTYALTLIDTLTINGRIFSDAIQVVASQASNHNNTVGSIWVKDVGMVSRTLINGEVWNLIRYHINN